MLDLTIFERALGIAGQDPAIDVLCCLFDAPETEKDHPLILKALESIGAGVKKAGKPAIIFSNMANNTFPVGRAAEAAAGLVYSAAGLDRGVTALGHALRWWERSGECSAAPLSTAAMLPPKVRPRLEREVLVYLAAHGVPVIPAKLATTELAAATAGREIGVPLVLKIVSAQIAHKTDVGGVALNVAPDQAGTEFQALIDRVGRAKPDAAIEGVILSPMRDKGIELFVGTLRDPSWGPAITVGFGGVFVELLKDTAVRLLPVTSDDVVEMLGELRGKAMLDGFRGAPRADIRAIADAVKAIGDAALALGPSLVALEVNPLLAIGDQVEALDGLAIWED